MPPVLLTLTGVVLLGYAFAAACVATGVFGGTDGRVATRLHAEPTRARIDDDATDDEVDGPDLVPRESSLGVLARLVPGSMLDRLERDLVLMGRPRGWTLKRVVTVKVVGALVGVLAGFQVAGALSGLVALLVGIGIPVVAFMAPDIVVNGRAQDRQAEIQRALPDLLDSVTIAVEAGMGFESALARAAERNRGPLGEELVRLIQDLRLGVSRRAAYRSLDDRTAVDDLTKLIRAIIQSEEFGVSMSRVVRVQSAEMRAKRKSRAETKAQEVSVKMLFPLMACILPVLFAIVLGPAILTAMQLF